MDLNNIILENTKEYSFSEIFSTSHRKIIIPDFQRDYCWGDKSHGSKQNEDIISGFLETLRSEYKNGTTLLGKIDVYQNPTNHIYLTDGQQRLTSMFLLIGMLHRATINSGIKEKLKKCLISEFEDGDDKEPYLQYSIRESSIFFLRDLVNNFFIKNNELKVEDISGQPWHFNEYKLDPTVISMLKALKIIQTFLEKKDDNFDIHLFADYVINRIKIQYYDVVDRKHGEERFVIINTTGKGLTATENVKPILLGNVTDKKYSSIWEERETWFWKNRNLNKEIIADDGVNDFLIWCFQIIEKQDDVDLIKKSKELIKRGDHTGILDKINSLFTSLKLLLDLLPQEDIQSQFQFINDGIEVKNITTLRDLSKEKIQNILLPLLAFIDKISSNEKEVYQFIRRLRKNYFDNKRKERNFNYVDWRHVIQIIDCTSNSEDVLTFNLLNEDEFRDIPNVENNIVRWYNTEEQIKSNLKQTNWNQIEEWEDRKDFMGDISTLLKIHLVNESSIELPEFESKIDILDSELFQKLKIYYENYSKLEGLVRSFENGMQEPILSNYFRLFKVYTNCNPIGGMYRTNAMEGVKFSGRNRNHLQSVECLKLFKTPYPLEFIKKYIALKIDNDKIFDSQFTFSAKKFIKGWLTLKVFNAEKMEVLLDYWNGEDTGIAFYTNANENLIFKDHPFSFGNCLCGFARKSGRGGKSYINYPKRENWNTVNYLDTPFAGITYEMFYNREIIDLEISQKAIEQNKLYIIELLASNNIFIELD